MSKYFDENGNEVEAYTEEDLKEKNQEAIDNYIKENPDKSKELTQANTDLDDANQKIKDFEEAGGGDEGQKKRLLNDKNKAETALDDVKTDFSKQINDLRDGFVSGSKTEIIEKLSGGDKELADKIELEYDDYSEGKDSPANNQEVQKRLEKAFTIATGKAPEPNFMDNTTGASAKGDVNDGGAGGSKEPENENSKSMRKVFDISDDDAKEFAPEDK